MLLKGAPKGLLDSSRMRDAVLATVVGKQKERIVAAKYGVPTRTLYQAQHDLKTYKKKIGYTLTQDDKQNQIFRWASKCCNVTIQNGYTTWELQEAAYAKAVGKMHPDLIVEYYGVPHRTFAQFMSPLLPFFGLRTILEVRKKYKKGEISNCQLTMAINNLPLPKSVGRPTYLSKDEEAMIVANAEVAALLVWEKTTIQFQTQLRG